jgi:hypothetical protein
MKLPVDKNLLLIDRNLQIALSVIVFLLIFPNLWVAHFKLTKDFGWGVYKKIGGSVMLQSKNTAFFFFFVRS